MNRYQYNMPKLDIRSILGYGINNMQASINNYLKAIQTETVSLNIDKILGINPLF